MNKEDLRFVKTEKIIIDTYKALINKGKAPTVTEICKNGLINKSTFYDHYETMEHLSNAINEEIVDGLIKSCPNIDKAIEDSGLFCHSIINHFNDNADLINKYFGVDKKSMCNYVEMSLYNIYKDKINNETLISFTVAGAASVLIKKLEPGTINDIADMISKLFNSKS